jgi:hypothetical protein
VSVSAAADVASEPAEAQHEIVARGEREILRKAQEIRAGLTEQRRAERIALAVELSARNAPLPADRKFALVLADPPWRYDFSMTSTRASRPITHALILGKVGLPVSDWPRRPLSCFCGRPSSRRPLPSSRPGFSYATGLLGERPLWAASLPPTARASAGGHPRRYANAAAACSAVFDYHSTARRHSEKPVTVYELIELCSRAAEDRTVRTLSSRRLGPLGNQAPQPEEHEAAPGRARRHRASEPQGRRQANDTRPRLCHASRQVGQSIQARPNATLDERTDAIARYRAWILTQPERMAASPSCAAKTWSAAVRRCPATPTSARAGEPRSARTNDDRAKAEAVANG